MADIIVTAANVLTAAGATIKRFTSGAAITAGQVVYKDTSASNVVKLADADLSDAAAVVEGIAINDCASGQEVDVCTSGNINPGGTVVVGEVYMASGNAGGIAPVGDFVSGDRASIIGVGTSTSNIILRIFNSGITRA